MTLPLRPKRGGFLCPFGCGWFIREFLAGRAPYGSPVVNSTIGAPQVDILRYHKEALRQISTIDRTTTIDIKRANKEKSHIYPNNISGIYSGISPAPLTMPMAAAIIALLPASLYTGN